MMPVLRALLLTLLDVARSRASLQIELLALRHQLQVLQRTRLVIVEPATIVAWHRRGVRLFWTWKSRRRTGRPAAAQEVRDLIRTMSAANPRWGASAPRRVTEAGH